MTQTRLYAFLALSKFPTAAQEDIVNNSCIKFSERVNIWSKDVLKIGKVQRRECKGKCNMVANLTLIVCLYLTCGFAGLCQLIARANTWQVTETCCHPCQIKNPRQFWASEHVVKKRVTFWLIALPKMKSRLRNKICIFIKWTRTLKGIISILLVINSWLVLRNSFRPCQGTHHRPFCLANSLGIAPKVPFANKIMTAVTTF